MAGFGRKIHHRLEVNSITENLQSIYKMIQVKTVLIFVSSVR